MKFFFTTCSLKLFNRIINLRRKAVEGEPQNDMNAIILIQRFKNRFVHKRNTIYWTVHMLLSLFCCTEFLIHMFSTHSLIFFHLLCQPLSFWLMDAGCNLRVHLTWTGVLMHCTFSMILATPSTFILVSRHKHTHTHGHFVLEDWWCGNQ